MKAARRVARRRIAQLQAALDTTATTSRRPPWSSPMDGVVTSLQKEEGEVVIGAQSFQPTVIMTVADLSVMEVEVMVDETDIRNVTLGQPAEVRVDALEGLKIKGEVTEIGSSAIPRGATLDAPATTAATPATRPRTSRSRHAQGPARRAPARAERHRRHHHRHARRTCWPCRSRPWWCARSTRRQGRRPRRAPRRRQTDTANAEAPPRRA